MCQRVTGPCQRDGVVVAQLDRQTGQPDALGELPRLIGHPAVDLAPAMTPGGHGMGRGKVWIQHDGLVKQRQRLIDRLPCPTMQIRHGAQIMIVGAEVTGWFSSRALDLRAFELRSYGADDAGCDLVLQLEDIVERSFKSLGPKMGARLSVAELSGDANPVLGL